MNATYPQGWIKDVVLKDGTAVQLRPIVPNDAAALQKFHGKQSPESVYMRFFTQKRKLTLKELLRFTVMDYQDRVAFAAVRSGKIIGTARYDRLQDSSTAEVAFSIGDEHQGKGLAPLLMEQLVDAARYNGIESFEATLLPENEAMLKVIDASGFKYEQQIADGLLNAHFSIHPTNISARKRLERSRDASVSAVSSFMEAEVVAIIGATKGLDTIGGRLTRQLPESFSGPIYSVNEDELEVGGTVTYSTIRDVPAHVDVALLAVPAERVLQAVKECGQAGVKAVVVYATGFGEWDSTDEPLQDAVIEQAREHGVRLLGPASLGFINNDPQHAINASFATEMFDSTGISVAVQSYASGVDLYYKFLNRKLGFRSLVATGNSADIEVQDIIQFWSQDKNCELGLAYIESFKSLVDLGVAVQHFTAEKTLVLGTPQFFETMSQDEDIPPGLIKEYLESSGAIVADTPERMLDVAEILRKQKLPQDTAVTIITNFPGVEPIAKYATEHYDLDVAEHIEISTNNGLDAFLDAVTKASGKKGIGAVLCVVIPQLSLEEGEIVKALNERSVPDTLLLASTVDRLDKYHAVSDKINCFQHFDAALYALDAIMKNVKRETADPETLALPPVYISRAQVVIDKSKKDFKGEVADIAVKKITDIYGLEYLNATSFTRVDNAVKLAKEHGFPVTVRPVDPEFHEQDAVSFVKANISDAASLKATVKELRTELKKIGPVDLEIFKTPRNGVNVSFEIKSHESLGNYLCFEIDEQKYYKVLPMTRADFNSLVSGKEVAQLLPADTEKLEEYIATLAEMKRDLPDIDSITCQEAVVSKHNVEPVKINITLKGSHD